MDPYPYDHSEYRHRFAVWAGALAAQRGFTTIERLWDALESTDVRVLMESPEGLNIEPAVFDDKHRTWCRQIVSHLNVQKIEGATYGRAAKLIGVYLKSMVVIAVGSSSRLAKVAHPPIDRVGLKNLAASKTLPRIHKSLWRNVGQSYPSKTTSFSWLHFAPSYQSPANGGVLRNIGRSQMSKCECAYYFLPADCLRQPLKSGVRQRNDNIE